MFKILLASLLGGVIFFIWNSISWMALPWHTQTIHNLKNEEVVQSILQENTEKSGIYILPDQYQQAEPDSADSKTNIEKPSAQDSKNQPFAFISYNAVGKEHNMNRSMVIALVNGIIASLIITLLLSCTTGLTYLARVFFITLIGLVSGLLGHVPNWIWWQFDTSYTLVMLADLIIGWTLAGLFIAAFAGREPKL